MRQTLKEMAKYRVLKMLEDVEKKIVWDLHEIINIFRIYGSVRPANQTLANVEQKDAERYLEQVLDKLKPIHDEIRKM